MRTFSTISTAVAVMLGLSVALSAVPAGAADSHRVVHCQTVRDAAHHDKGRMCVFAFLNPHIQERHYRAEVSFTSLKGGSLARVHGSKIYVTLDGKRYAVRRNPSRSAAHHALKLWLMSGWAAHGEPTNIKATIRFPCMVWRNGGRACLSGSFSGGIPGNVT